MILNVAANVIHDSSKAVVGRAKTLVTKSLVDKNISKCSKNFPSFEDLEKNLETWIDSIELRDLAVSAAVDTSVGVDQLAQAFVESSNFFDGENTQSSAEKVIEFFLAELVADLRTQLEFNVSVVEGLMRQSLSEQRQSFQQLTSNLTRGDDGALRHPEEQATNAQIDAANKLIKSGNPKSGRKLLLSLREELQQQKQTSSDVLYRVALNIGNASVELDEWDIAIKEYELAARLKEDGWKPLANLSHVHYLSGDFEKAVHYADSAFKLSPDEPYVTAIRILAYHSANKIDSIESDLLNWKVCDNATILLALGQINYDMHHYLNAADIFQKVIDRESSNSLAKVMKAQSLLVPIQDRYDESRNRGNRLTDKQQAYLSEAASLLESAIRTMEQNEATPGLSRARLALVSVLFFLGDDSAAIKVCDSVSSTDPLSLHAIRAKALIEFSKGEVESARNTLSQLKDELHPEIILPLAEIYVEQKNYSKAIQILESLLEQENLNSDVQLAAIERALYASWRSGNSEPAKILDRLLTLEKTGLIEASSIRAVFLLRQGKTNQAIELLNSNLTRTSKDKKDGIRQLLMYAYALGDELDKAIEIYKSLDSPHRPSQELRTLLMKLFESEKRQIALEILRDLRSANGAIAGFIDIEASLLSDLGEIDLAKELLLAAAEQEPENYHHILNVVTLCTRLGQEDTARSLLKDLHFDDISNDSKAIMRLAYAHLSTGNKDPVLDLAYKARCIEPNSPEIHLAFVDIFLRVNFKVSIEEATVDCCVSLKRGDHTIEYTILRDGSPLNGPRDLAESDTLAKRIIGKKIGDVIRVRDDQFGSVDYTIANIRHKWIAAFQDSLNEFTHRFPDQPGLRAIEDPKLEQLFASVERWHQRSIQLEQLYSSGGLPLESIADLAGISSIDFWFSTSFGNSTKLMARYGNQADFEEEVRAAEDAKSFVIDLTALLTLSNLNLLDELSALKKPIILSQFTLDELTVQLFDVMEQRISYIGKAGDRYRISEYTVEDNLKKRRLLESTRAFALNNLEIQGIGSLSAELVSDIESHFEAAGRAGYSSILIAQNNGSCLLSDDVCLRRLAKGEFRAAGCSSYVLIKLLLDSEIIDKDRYKELVNLLALYNYYFLPVRAEDLTWALEQSSGTVTLAVTNVINLLADPNIDSLNAAQVGAEFLRQVWFKVLIPEQRIWAAETLLAALVKNRPPKRVLVDLERQVRGQFAFMPIHEDEALDTIRWFRAVRGL